MAKFFKGIRRVSKNKYKQLRDANALDDEMMYITPEVGGIELKDSETIKVYEDPADGLTELMIDTEILNDINMSLRLPASSPIAVELVAVDNTKSQKMIEIGEGLVLENGVLKATGVSGTTNVSIASYSLTEDEVISKKRLLWSGELKFGDGEIVLPETINYNDIYEIQYKWGSGIYFEKFQIRPMINNVGQIESIKISRVNVNSGAFVRFSTAEISIGIPDNTFEVISSYYVYQLLSGEASNEASNGPDLEFIVQKIWKVIEE